MIKNYELEPTFENVAETLLNDTLKRNNYLYKFYDLLKCINSSCSICLDGAWGSGKTFFVKQAQLLLLSENPLLEIGKLDIDITEEEKEQINDLFAEFEDIELVEIDGDQQVYSLLIGLE